MFLVSSIYEYSYYKYSYITFHVDTCSHFFLEEMKAYVSSIIYKGVEFSGQMVTICV